MIQYMVDNFDSNFLAMSCRPEFMNMLVSQTLGNHRSTPKKASFRNGKMLENWEKPCEIVPIQAEIPHVSGHRIRRLDTVVGRGNLWNPSRNGNSQTCFYLTRPQSFIHLFGDVNYVRNGHSWKTWAAAWMFETGIVGLMRLLDPQIYPNSPCFGRFAC